MKWENFFFIKAGKRRNLIYFYKKNDEATYSNSGGRYAPSSTG